MNKPIPSFGEAKDNTYLIQTLKSCGLWDKSLLYLEGGQGGTTYALRKSNYNMEKLHAVSGNLYDYTNFTSSEHGKLVRSDYAEFSHVIKNNSLYDGYYCDYMGVLLGAESTGRYPIDDVKLILAKFLKSDKESVTVLITSCTRSNIDMKRACLYHGVPARTKKRDYETAAGIFSKALHNYVRHINKIHNCYIQLSLDPEHYSTNKMRVMYIKLTRGQKPAPFGNFDEDFDVVNNF